jgi:hypothetical protein
MVRGASFLAGAGAGGAAGVSWVAWRRGATAYSVFTAWPPNSLRSAASTLAP